jgi:porin
MTDSDQHPSARRRPARALAVVRAGLVAFWLGLAGPALAADGLTGDWGGTRTTLAENGFSLRSDITGFYQGGSVEGTEADASGRFDVFSDLDFGKMGVIKGLGFHFHGEIRFGDPRSNFGGELWPSNTGAALPLGGADKFVASSLYFTQTIGKRSVLLLGKINAVDLLAGDPFYGGWGTQRFMNIAFVAPPSGVVPPTIIGAVFVMKGDPITLTLMAFDPDDRTNDYFPGDLFSAGINLSVGATWNGMIAGRASSFGVTSTVSTARGLNLQNILLPPGLETSTRQGSFNIAFSAAHLLVESREVKGKGLGVYVKAAVADGNPNVIQTSVVGGIGGEALIPGRPGDAFAVGGFFYNFSNVLQDTIEPALNFDDEAGMEAWYRFQLTPWFALTADLQVVDPASGDRPTFVLGAIRANLKF